MECLMQFFHFKEIPPASSFPQQQIQLFSALSSGKENNPSLVLPSLDQTQLLQSACSSPTEHTHTHTLGLRGRLCSIGKLEGPLAGPGPFVFDGQRRQTVIGGLARPRAHPFVSYSCQSSVQLLGGGSQRVTFSRRGQVSPLPTV